MIEIYAQYIDKEAIMIAITVAVWMTLCVIAHRGMRE